MIKTNNSVAEHYTPFPVPEFLEDSNAFFYCPKNKLQDLYSVEGFVPLSVLLEGDNVNDTIYNTVGQLNGKNILVK